MGRQESYLSTKEQDILRQNGFETAPQFECDELQLAVFVGKIRAHLRQRNRERVDELVDEYFSIQTKHRMEPHELPDDAMLCDVIELRLSNALEQFGITTVDDARKRVTLEFRERYLGPRQVENIMRAVGTWNE